VVACEARARYNIIYYTTQKTRFDFLPLSLQNNDHFAKTTSEQVTDMGNRSKKTRLLAGLPQGYAPAAYMKLQPQEAAGAAGASDAARQQRLGAMQ
jgi:hypothetical protein